jgi:agmatinase
METLKKMLRPPGNGVFTVHTASDVIEQVQATIYPQTTVEKIPQEWEASLKELKSHEGPVILGICSDCGGGIHRGANWGPLFVRQYLYKYGDFDNVLDIGDIKVIPHLLHDKYLNQETITECREALYQDKQEPLPVSPLSIAQKVCDEINNLPNRPSIFSIGGDHSVSYPVVKSWLQAKKKQGKKVAILHFDAHTDLMEKRQGIDLCFATWAYQVLQDLDDPSLMIQFGIRSSGQPKEYWESKLGIKQYWADEITNGSIPKIYEEVIEHLEKYNIDEVYVSVDIDAIDEEYASATGTPEKNGLSPEMPAMILSPILERFKATGADVVEVAPWIQRIEDNKIQNTVGAKKTLLTAQAISQFLIDRL